MINDGSQGRTCNTENLCQNEATHAAARWLLGILRHQEMLGTRIILSALHYSIVGMLTVCVADVGFLEHSMGCPIFN